MDCRHTEIDGLRVIVPKKFADQRGEFVKTYHIDMFREMGIEFQPVEEFFSVSKQGVLRGMHFQVPPKAHDKVVYCLAGRVLDVVVDLRKGSPTYGRYLSLELNHATREMLFLPAGLAHGFLTLSTEATMFYQTSTMHAPEHDTGILWNSFGFEWPEKEPIVSERDAGFAGLAEFESPF